MGALRLPALTSIFTSSSSTVRPLSAQSTAEKVAATEVGDGKVRVIDKEKDRVITSLSEDFNAWYLDVIYNAELADYGPVRGTMVIRPYGYAIWEAIQEYMNVKFKETGHSNMYFLEAELLFPPFIPYSFIEKEASHVEGFSPELALVTVGGGKELEEKLVVRLTSETIVNHMFTQWIHSYRGLPLMINQRRVMLPMLLQKKCGRVFAGASTTYTIEAMMGDRKALQAGTSHNLGQNFSRAFGTQMKMGNDNMSGRHHGQFSTRFVGGIIMTHGDDAGLLLPPRLASVQIVIVPIWKDNEKTGVLTASSSVKETLQAAGIKVKIDDSDLRTPGWKFNYYEMKGVPLRIEIGPRDVSNGTVVISRRDVPGKQGKVFGISMEPSALVAYVKDKLNEVQSSLLERATTFRDSNIVDVYSYNELKEVIAQGKWARGPWSADDEEELKVKEETGATIRCFPFEQPEGPK
ncbi:unnamed protein product [Withania somnifera]